MLIQRNDLYDQLVHHYKENNGKMKEINIFGIRDERDQDKDIFGNDWLGINIGNYVWIWKGTTDPGAIGTRTSEKGVAHLALGFHEDIWVMDVHNASKPTAHKALCSRKEKGCRPTLVWRDKNKNFKNDDGFWDKGFFGINFHRASAWKILTKIGWYSLGCQVTQDKKDFDKVIKMIESTNAFKNNPNYLFSYLLTSIDEWVL